MFGIIIFAFNASALAAMITSRSIGRQLLSTVDALMNGDMMGGARSSAMHPLQGGRYTKPPGLRLRATTITFQQNQSAFRRLIGVMLGISALVSVSATVLQLALVRSDQGFRMINVVAYITFFLFPLVPVSAPCCGHRAGKCFVPAFSFQLSLLNRTGSVVSTQCVLNGNTSLHS